MENVPIKLVMKNYDHVAPLACGDVGGDGIDLELDRASPMNTFQVDSSYQAGEMSFSGYLIRLAQGDRQYVGLPIFPTRAFRHRCFFVRRDSGLQDFADLAGRRIGANAWPDTGNTWSRAAMRERGVDIERIDWFVGEMDESTATPPLERPVTARPPNVQDLPDGQTLVALLLAGKLDALMVPLIPKIFYDPDSPIVRLFPDYRRVEKEYLGRVGIYPIHHIIALRRDAFERTPWIARSLYDAFDASRLFWQERRRALVDTTPWLLPEIEETTELLGYDWQPNGIAANRKAIEALCAEEYAQKLVTEPIDPATVFADFEQAMT